jgi:hypothetical protein
MDMICVGSKDAAVVVHVRCSVQCSDARLISSSQLVMQAVARILGACCGCRARRMPAYVGVVLFSNGVQYVLLGVGSLEAAAGCIRQRSRVADGISDEPSPQPPPPCCPSGPFTPTQPSAASQLALPGCRAVACIANFIRELCANATMFACQCIRSCVGNKVAAAGWGCLQAVLSAAARPNHQQPLHFLHTRSPAHQL